MTIALYHGRKIVTQNITLMLHAFCRCVCPAGFTDKNCSTNIDDCKDHICQHGSMCIDGVDSYTCSCPRSYTGKYCEIGPVRHPPGKETGLCQNHDCQNNGICYQADKSADYMCKCVAGMYFAMYDSTCTTLHSIICHKLWDAGCDIHKPVSEIW